MNDKIKKLQEKIEAEKRKILYCKHDFDKAFYNPEIVIDDGYKKKERWTRKCKKCEFEQNIV
jgi:hypothetical protein